MSMQPGLVTFEVSNGSSFLQAIQRCKDTGRRIIIRIKDYFKENFWRLLNRLSFGVITATTTAFVLSTSSDNTVEICAIGGAIGSFSYHVLETALTELTDVKGQLSRIEEDHKKEIADLKEAHQKETEALKTELTDVKTELTDVKGQLSRMERMLMEEREDHKKDIADLKAMMQQFQANQQQNRNAQ